MASTGLNSTQCRNHVPFASTFWHDYEASMVMLICTAFLIPVLIVLLLIINLSPNDGSQRGSPPNHCNPDIALPTDRNAAHYILDRIRPSNSRIGRGATWVCSTTLLGIAASLLTFQILIALFTQYCILELVHTSELVFVCTVAAVGAILVAVGLITWLVSSVILVNDFMCRWLNIKRRMTRRARNSTMGDVRNTSPLEGLQRREQQVIGQEHVKPPTATLPPYMV